MVERIGPGTRSDYKVFRTIGTRWSDNDTYGHMNNVVHYSFFDSAVNGFLIESGVLDIKGGSGNLPRGGNRLSLSCRDVVSRYGHGGNQGRETRELLRSL